MAEESTKKRLYREFKEKFGYKAPLGMSNKDLQDCINGVAKPPREGERRRRKQRVPLGGHRSKLTIEGYDIPSNKVARWINDKPGRLRAAQDGGYEFVEDPDSRVQVGEEPMTGREPLETKVSRFVGPDEQGKPMKAYLMVIDKELYEEDQAEKQKIVDETDKAIKFGMVGAQEDDKRYVPKNGIKIESNM